MLEFADEETKRNHYFLLAWEYGQKRKAKMHARINARGGQLDWAIAEQALKTAYIKEQHDLPF